MNLTDLTTYLSGLLDRPIDGDTRITLTSGQQARMQGWMQQRGVDTQAMNLARSFTSAELLGTAPDTAATPAPASTASTPVAIASAIGALGVDIQSIDELVPAAALNDLKAHPELSKIFTLRELSYAQTKADPASTLAGLFAAKEAVKKASRAHMGLAWQEIEVLPDADGAPGVAGFMLSISHSKDYAVAVAMAGAAPGAVPIASPAASTSEPAPARVAAPPAPAAPASKGSADGGARVALVAWAVLATAACIYLAR